MPAIVGGMARLQEQLNEIGAEFTPEDLQRGAMVILDRAQQLVPVDTGFLHNSAFIQVGADDVLFGFEADYASYVEFGTYKMAAQPYLRPAIDDAEQDALDAILVSIQSHLGVGGGSRGIPTQSQLEGEPMTVQTVIHGKLKAVGATYPDQLPTNPSLPSTTYKFVSLNQSRHHGGNSLGRYRLQVDCWAKTRGAANTLADSVKTALDLNQTNVKLITTENAVDLNEPESGIFRRMLEFYVWD